MSRKDNTAPPQNYAVGYGRPPAHTRFQPGHSGNPKGRLKGIKNMATTLSEVLSQKVIVRGPEGAREVPLQKALLLRYVERALQGNMKALLALIQLSERYVTHQGADLDHQQLEEADYAIIDARLAELEAIRLATNKKKR